MLAKISYFLSVDILKTNLGKDENIYSANQSLSAGIFVLESQSGLKASTVSLLKSSTNFPTRVY